MSFIFSKNDSFQKKSRVKSGSNGMFTSTSSEISQLTSPPPFSPSSPSRNAVGLSYSSSRTSVEAFPVEDSCLEGNLKMRKGRSTGHGSVKWKEHFVHFRFRDGGSLAVYEGSPPESPRHGGSFTEQELGAHSKLVVFIGNDLPWVAKDVHNS